MDQRLATVAVKHRHSCFYCLHNCKRKLYM